jgi:hypothetical protein
MKRNNPPDRHVRRGIPLLVLAASIGLFLSGCAGGGKSVRIGEADEAGVALRHLAALAPSETITATARIDITAHAERRPLKAAMLMKKPASVRLESIPLMGPPDLFLTIGGGELRVFLPGKGAFYRGKATERNIARFFPLALPPDELVSLLMGQVPDNGEDSLSWDGRREDGLYRIDQYRAARRIRSLWIDPSEGFLTRVRTYAQEGEIAYTADLSGHTRVGSGFMPERLTISGGDVTMVLRYTEILPFDDDETLFVLPVPEGIAPISLD